MVDGRDLAAMLLHHQHVLDGYRFGILRRSGARGKGDPRSEMLRGIKLELSETTNPPGPNGYFIRNERAAGPRRVTCLNSRG